ncbi:hypothetical protein AA21291_0330 [Swaminathania salitolerans LMG 21291]|uniref:Uncharacterized protein n=1 Tax=Swaminathania salitolerans TaxID=182838 RepID=A0A511BLH3_9PROT|nr:hypothetical protein AA21291_0330 [Swaminathania salitolerans LMG 21291]GEL01189.1 hypothetical protein SSA02_03520 [Swaminathania salitolerans]
MAEIPDRKGEGIERECLAVEQQPVHIEQDPSDRAETACGIARSGKVVRVRGRPDGTPIGTLGGTQGGPTRPCRLR